MTIAVIFASGKGQRLKTIIGETPKHLLEIDSENSNPLRRTLVGRLVSQFTAHAEIEKVIVICAKPLAFEEYFSHFSELKGKMLVKKVEFSYDWRRNIRFLRKLVGDTPSIGIAGDVVIKDEGVQQALKAAKSKKVTVFFARTVNRPLLSPRVMTTFWASGKGVPRWALLYNPESWSALPKALLAHGRNINIAKGIRAMNVNTPKDYYGVRDLIKQKRWR